MFSFRRTHAPLLVVVFAATALRAQSQSPNVTTVTVVSAADYGPALAPGSIASAFGSGFAEAPQTATLDAVGQLPTELSGVSISLAGQKCQLFYVSANHRTLNKLYFKDSPAIYEVYGRSWAERLTGVGDWIHGGVATVINSDHMIGMDPNHAMNSFNPFLQAHIAVSRKKQQGQVLGERQKISRMAALRSMTHTAAYVSFTDQATGTLEPGKLADLAVLDRDYLTCPEKDIRKISVLLTMVGGQTVFNRNRQPGK